MSSYRKDGQTRKSTSIYLSPEAKYIFDSNSNISISDFLEEQIYEHFDNITILEQEKERLLNRIKIVNENIIKHRLKDKHLEEIKEVKNICCVCGSERDNKKLLKLYKDKDFLICRKCYDSISPQDIKNKLIEKKENEK